MPRSKIVSNRPHWHVLARHGNVWAFAGVRMNARERDDEGNAGRKRVVRRWFTSPAAARNLKDRLVAKGRKAMTFQCPEPDWCEHGPA